MKHDVSHLSLLLCLILFLNPLFIHRSESALAIPVLTSQASQYVVAAIGTCAALCYRAYYARNSSLICQQLSKPIHDQETQEQSQPACQHISQQTVATIAPEKIIDYAIAHVSLPEVIEAPYESTVSMVLPHDEAIRSASQRAAANIFAQSWATAQAEYHSVAKPYAKEGLLTLSYPVAGGRTYSNRDGTLRMTLGAYVGPTPAQMREYRFVEREYARYTIMHHYQRSSDFRQQFDREIGAIYNNLLHINHPNFTTRVTARLAIPLLTSCSPYLNDALQKTIARLCTMFFDNNGTLIDTQHHNRCIPYIKQILAHISDCLCWPMPQLSSIPGMTEQDQHDRGFWNTITNALWYQFAGVTARTCGQNNENQAIMRVILACDRGDFITAAHHATNNIARTMYSQFLCHAYASFAPDPWATMNDANVRMYASNPDLLIQKLTQLMTRKHIVQSICIAWNIHPVAGSQQCNALYDFVFKMMHSDQTPLSIMKSVSEVVAQYNDQAVTNMFYLPNGIMRDFGQYHIASRLVSQEIILLPEHQSARTALNYLVYLHEHTSEPTRVVLEYIVDQLFSSDGLHEYVQLFDVICNTQILQGKETILDACSRVIDIARAENLLPEYSLPNVTGNWYVTIFPPQQPVCGCGEFPDHIRIITKPAGCGGNIPAEMQGIRIFVYPIYDNPQPAVMRCFTDQPKPLLILTQGVTIPENVPKNIPLVGERPTKTVKDILRDAKPGRKTYGVTRQYEKPGGYDDAVKDFESLDVRNIHDIPDGKAGVLPDGRKISIRTKSSDTRATLQIDDKITDKKIKIRYGDKL